MVVRFVIWASGERSSSEDERGEMGMSSEGSRSFGRGGEGVFESERGVLLLGGSDVG